MKYHPELENQEPVYHALCFFDHDKGRDLEMMIPLVYYAEKILNCKVESAFIWDIYAIYRKQPDFVIIPNTVGSIWNYLVSKYAHQQGIKVFALISEGNFRTDGSFDYWGYNYDRIFYQEFVCHWSKRTCDFLISELPQFKEQMVLTGATGFDRFKLYKFKSRNDFFEKYGLKHFDRVIGYAGWAFGKLFDDRMIGEMVHLHENNPEKIQYLKNQMYLVEDVLRQLVLSNPDTLFILKRHPNEVHPHIIKKETNEMIRLKDYPNVLYLVDEEEVHNLISISDLWLGYETTTALESWLLNKVTILINPDPNFVRDKLMLGSVVVQSNRELSALLDEYYKTGTIAAFQTEERTEHRKRLIKETIGFSDGLNHIRTGLYLEKVLKRINRETKKRSFSFRFWWMYVLMNIGKLFYIKSIFIRLPKFKKTVWIFDRYRLKNLASLKSKYYHYLDEFYATNDLRTKIADKEFRQKLFE